MHTISMTHIPALALITIDELRTVFARARYAAELQAFHAAQAARCEANNAVRATEQTGK